MKSIAAFVLGLGLFATLNLVGTTQDKKEEKKVEAPNLEGKYTLISGKKNNEAVSEDAKKWDYTFTADKITLKGADLTFVMSYKLDPKTSPINIDMEIIEGPEGTKGIKSNGIIEIKGDTLKLAYSLEKDKRSKNFEGKEGHMFEFKKNK
jgi:uncharacterized protein (TIGR03067 family)